MTIPSHILESPLSLKTAKGKWAVLALLSIDVFSG